MTDDEIQSPRKEPFIGEMDSAAPSGPGEADAGTGQNPQNPTPPLPAGPPPARGMSNFLKNAWTGKNRPYVLILAVALLLAGGLVADKIRSGGKPIPRPSDLAPSLPNQRPMPGAATSPYVEHTLQRYNAAQGAQAAQSGKSYFPVMGPLKPVKPLNEQTGQSQTQTPPQMPPRAAGYSAYPSQEGMEKEINAIIKDSNPGPVLTANVQESIPGLPGAPTTSANGGGYALPVAATGSGMAGGATGPVLARPGHISFAVLDTYTNYHTLYRYGWLIGSGLLEGVSNVLQSANSSTYITGSGLAVATQQLSNGQIAASAIGNVGTVLAPIMAQRFNTPPTVHEAAGTGIGILFMAPVQQGAKSVSASMPIQQSQAATVPAPVNIQ